MLMRSGHTEAAVDLCQLAGLPPVAVICELANDDGTVMVGAQIEAFAEQAQAQAHLGRRPHRLPAGAREAGRARRHLPGQDADRRAHRLRLLDALRPGAAFRLRARPHRRRRERADAAASRRHPATTCSAAAPIAQQGAGPHSRQRGAACSSICATARPACRSRRCRAARTTAPEAARNKQWREIGARRPDPARPRRQLDPAAASSDRDLCRPVGLRHRDRGHRDRSTA